MTCSVSSMWYRINCNHLFVCAQWATTKKNDRTKCVEQTEQPLKNVCLRNVFQAYQGEHNLDNKANERKKLEDITEH